MKIQALRVPEPGGVELVALDIPDPEAGEVIVETLYSAVSPGTELAWSDAAPGTPGKFPHYPGYSGVGRVVRRGATVEQPAEGQLVAARLKHATHTRLAADACRPIPDDADLPALSTFRLASIALQGIRKPPIGIGDCVAALGLGPVGLLAAQLARIAGAGEVTGFDLLDWRRDLATSSGTDRAAADVTDPHEHGGFDVVIETTGSPRVLPAGLKLAKNFGTVVLLGSPRGVAPEVDFYADVHRRGVTLVGAHESLRATTDADQRGGRYRTHATDELVVLRLAEQGRLQLAPLVSEVATPDAAADVYRRLRDRDQQLMTVIFDWSGIDSA